MLVTCDGNDSLKRVANASVVNRHPLQDNYFLESAYVDRFENEVQSRANTTLSKVTIVL